MPAHPASAIPARIEGLTGPFQLRSLACAPIRQIDRDELEVYVQAGVVTGHWNANRFKYAQFTAEEDEVNRVLGECARDVRITRARTPLDLLMKMATNRKFGGWHHETVIRNGRPAAARWFEHNMERCKAQMSPRHAA